MATRDVFINKFEALLETIPNTYSLQQWQYAYRNVIYSMGLKILNNFRDDVVGLDPSEPIWAAPNSTGTSAGEVSARTGSGPHPNVIVCKLVCSALDVGS